MPSAEKVPHSHGEGSRQRFKKALQRLRNTLSYWVILYISVRKSDSRRLRGCDKKSENFREFDQFLKTASTLRVAKQRPWTVTCSSYHESPERVLNRPDYPSTTDRHTIILAYCCKRMRGPPTARQHGGAGEGLERSV
jgi:hypothetical protein